MGLPIAGVTVFWENNAVADHDQSRILTKFGGSSSNILRDMIYSGIVPVKRSKWTYGINTYWEHNEASTDITGYYQLTASSADVAECAKTATLNLGESVPKVVYIGSWVTESGIPGETVNFANAAFNLGQWAQMIQDSVLHTEILDAYLYKRNSTGTETLLAEGHSSFGNLNKTERNFIFYVTTNWTSTDRLVIVLYVKFDLIGSLD